MRPVKILYHNFVTNFNSNWVSPVVAPYLEFERWDPQRTYPRNTLFYMSLADFPTPAHTEFSQHILNLGFRIVIDNLWEADPGPIPDTHRIICDQWFWYNESLWYQYLGYDQYKPCSQPQYLALMPMNRQKPHRTQFLAAVDHIKDQLLWSYVAQGRQLPGDGDMSDWNTQRFMNPDWYDSTYLSMVVETAVRPLSRYTPCFITEKTMKPLAFKHPFIVYGNRNTLQTLRDWGFETFDHLWSESYDTIVDVDQRRAAVVQTLAEVQREPHSAETIQRLEHNYNRFFNKAVVQQGIIQRIVEPILHYAETAV